MDTVWLSYEILSVAVTATPVSEGQGAQAACGKWPHLGTAWGLSHFLPAGHIGSSCAGAEDQKRINHIERPDIILGTPSYSHLTKMFV